MKDQRPQNVYPGGLFGSACHLALEDSLIMQNDGVQLNIIENEFKESFAKYFKKAKSEIRDKDEFKESKEYRLHKKEFEKSGDKAIINIIQFMNKYIKTFDNIYPEKKYTTSWNENLNCTGVIDVKIESEGKVYILDLKITGDSTKYWWTNWNTDIQSLMYDFLIYSDHKVVPESFGYLVYDRNLKMLFLKERNIKPNTLETVTAKLNKFIHKIEDFQINHTEELAISMAIPEKSQCNWCSYKCPNKYQEEIVKKARGIKK